MKMPDCKNCTKKCPQAELAHNAALGRMYATSELVSIIKKIDSGELAEVVRCRGCRHWNEETGFCNLHSHFSMDGLDWDVFNDDDFCSQGERKKMTEHMEVRTNEQIQ